MRSDKKLNFQVVVFTLTRVVINTSFRMVYPFLPAIGRGLKVSFEQVSRALSWRALLGVFGPFLASLSDSRGRKTGMLAGLGILVVGLAVVVFWPTYIGFVISLVLATLGKFAFDPSMQAYLGDRVPYERRGALLAITELGWSGAFFLGMPMAGFMIAKAGWLAPFPLLAGLALLCWLILLWLLPPDTQPETRPPGLLRNFRTVLTSGAALSGLAVTLFVSTSNEFVNLVFGGWLEGSFAFKVATLGQVAAMIGGAELLGEVMVSRVSDRLGKRRAVALGLMFNSLAGVALPYLGQSRLGALFGLFLFYLGFEFTFVSLIPLMTEILPGARATLMAFNIASASLGRFLAAWAAPWLAASTFAGSGFSASAFASAGVNLLALLALRGALVAQEE